MCVCVVVGIGIENGEVRVSERLSIGHSMLKDVK